MDPALPVGLIVALLAGLGAGWWLGQRGIAALRAERDEVRKDFNRAITDLAAAATEAKQVEPLKAALADATRERDAASRDLAALRAAQEEREQAHALRLTELREAKDALSAQFNEVGGKLLDEAQKAFLERADQRFRQSEETSGDRLKALLQPVNERLTRYEEGVARIEKERTEAHGNLIGLIEGMRAGQEAVRAEAARLVNSLRSAPKARGRWGEQQLRNVLETCGLSEHCDFSTEVSVETEGGRLRPDVLIHVPGGRELVIDAKVSLNAYQDAFAATDEAERAGHLAAHAAAMKAHVNTLGAKAYWDVFKEAPDYVIMFVPGEHFLAAALEHDPTLWDFAFDKRVLLATPTNLIAIARTVASVWKQERLANETRRISELGKEMYDRLAVAADKLRVVGGGLNTAVKNYNAFVSSFESRVMVTGRKFRDLNIETGARALDEIAPVEMLARGDALPGPDETAEAAE